MDASTRILPFAAKPAGPNDRFSWCRRIHGEPPIEELLHDPILHLVMKRDGVSAEELSEVIAEARAKLRRDLCRELDPAA